MDPVRVLETVAEEVKTCQLCVLKHSRKRAVPGEGPANAEVMFIGEGPGFYENEQGRPFVGAAGKFLEELLAAVDLKREQVYITNVVKCRPPGNRDPQPEEVDTCTSRYLDRQIQAINPKVIVTLGRFSMGLFLKDAKISLVHGQPIWIKGRLIVPMYHPAAALHQQSLRPTLVKDFSRLPEFIQRAVAVQEAPSADSKGSETAAEKKEPKQLTLF